MSQKILSLEVWDRRAAIVQLQRSWGGIRFEDSLLLDIPSEVKDEGMVARYTAEKAHESGFSGHRVVLGLGADHAYMQELKFPFSSRHKIERALPGDMESTLSLNGEDFVFDACILGETRRKHCRVLAAALPRRTLDQWVRSLRDFGLEPDRIDLIPSALAELGSQIPTQSRGAVSVAWHMGRTRSSIVFVRNGRLERTENVWTGTEDLARTLADKTGGSREKALSGIERGWFFQPVPDSEKGSTCAKGEALSECARMARDELMRSVERFQREHPGSLVEKVVLSGRGARWKGLATAIAVQSTIPLSVAQDFALPFDASGVEKSEIPEVASAACLGVIARKRARGCWNFRKKEMAGTSQARGWRRFALDIGVGIGIVLLCAVISLSFHIWLNNLELREVQDRTGPVLKDTVSGASSSLRPAHYLSVIQERINALREEVEHSSSSERGSDLAEFLLSFGNSPSKGEKALEKGTHWVRKREKERMNRLVHE